MHQTVDLLLTKWKMTAKKAKYRQKQPKKRVKTAKKLGKCGSQEALQVAERIIKNSQRSSR